jgi:DNA-3-methyladenine glycosylase
MTSWDSIGIECGFGEPLGAAFFDRDPRAVAPDLLGRIVASVAQGGLVAGRIVETEAYLGAHDPGSHAATKGVTQRNRVMYGPPGTVYVYFTYGNHHMLNLVCEARGTAGAVLLRALEPLVGEELMEARRGGRRRAELANGPGKLTAALGVDLTDNGVQLGSGRLHVYAGMRLAPECIASTGRIGLGAGHDLPYRYYESTSPFVSRGRPGQTRNRSGRRGTERSAQ